MRPSATILFLFANTLVFVRMLATGHPTEDEVLRSFGSLRADLFWQGEAWRLVTATFVHIGALHFLMNMIALWILGPAAERDLGAARFAAVYLFAGALGFVFSIAWRPYRVYHETVVSWVSTAGASGAIFGILGMLIASEMRRGRHLLEFYRYPFGRVLVVYTVLSFSFGLLVDWVNNEAHLGGFVGGFVAVFFLFRYPWRPASLVDKGIACAVWFLVLELVFYAFHSVGFGPFHALKGEEAYLRAQYPAAVRHCRAALSLSGHDRRSGYYLGRVLEKSGEDGPALDHYQRASKDRHGEGTLFAVDARCFALLARAGVSQALESGLAFLGRENARDFARKSRLGTFASTRILTFGAWIPILARSDLKPTLIRRLRDQVRALHATDASWPFLGFTAGVLEALAGEPARSLELLQGARDAYRAEAEETPPPDVPAGPAGQFHPSLFTPREILSLSLLFEALARNRQGERPADLAPLVAESHRFDPQPEFAAWIQSLLH